LTAPVIPACVAPAPQEFISFVTTPPPFQSPAAAGGNPGGAVLGERLKFVDGIRGWGSLVVLLYHLFCVCLPLPGTNTGQLGRWLPFDGSLAAAVFFSPLDFPFRLAIGAHAT
jgi:hypothetical protein